MYNVLIAEDSKPILRNIRGLLEASGLPVRIAATAANGEEALEAIRTHSVDILLTDIRMPKMDGLTLIAEAKRLHPKLKAVLISGYNDFEYTRKALNLQVSDYLLKPVDRKQLTEVMQSVLGQLQETREQAATLFRDIVEESYWREMDRKAEFYEREKTFVVLRRQPFAEGADKLTPAFVASRLRLPDPAWVIPMLAADRLLVAANGDWAAEVSGSPLPLLEDIRLRLLDAGLPVSVAGSFKPMEWSLLPEKVKEAADSLEEQLLLFKPVSIDCDHPRPSIEPGFEEIDRLGGQFASVIEQQLNKDRFVLMLSEQLAKWKLGSLRLVELKRFLGHVGAAFEPLLEDGEGSGPVRVYAEFDRLLALPGYELFCSSLLATAEEWLDEARSRNRKAGDELFREIEQYLRTNLYASVSIPDLANRFHVSPSYVSRIVKRFSGQTFVHYYTDLKISEARRLMETRPDMLIREIAEALCFGDQHYFSKVFKERVGCSPVEYKSRI